MSRRKTIILDRKEYQFNNKKLSELCEKMAKDKKVTKDSIYYSIYKRLYKVEKNPGYDKGLYDAVRKWHSTNVQPSLDDIEYLGKFYGLNSKDELLIEIKCKKEEKKSMHSINEKSNWNNNKNINKFNSVQINEFEQIRSLIINLYDEEYYNIVMERILNEPTYEDKDDLIKEYELAIPFVIKRTRDNGIKEQEIYSKEELKELKEIAQYEERFNKIQMSLEFEGLELKFASEDDKKFYDNHYLDILKIRTYRNISFHKDKIYLYLRVYKSMSLFPDDVIEKLITILDIIQNYDCIDYDESDTNYELECANISFGKIDLSVDKMQETKKNEIKTHENKIIDEKLYKTNGFILVNKILRSIINDYYM